MLRSSQKPNLEVIYPKRMLFVNYGGRETPEAPAVESISLDKLRCCDGLYQPKNDQHIIQVTYYKMNNQTFLDMVYLYKLHKSKLSPYNYYLDRPEKFLIVREYNIPKDIRCSESNLLFEANEVLHRLRAEVKNNPAPLASEKLNQLNRLKAITAALCSDIRTADQPHTVNNSRIKYALQQHDSLGRQLVINTRKWARASQAKRGYRFIYYD